MSGAVVDAATDGGVGGVALVLEGTDVSAVTADDGTFTLRGVTPGRWTLVTLHVAYGEHRHEVVLDGTIGVALQIRLAPEAITLEPVVVEATTSRQRAARARGSSRNVVERPQIEAALGVSRHLGDLLGRTIPGIRLRQSNNLAGTDVCLEFRSAADISMLETRACNHPLVVLDGVPISNPNFAYGTIGLNSIQRIEVLPPGEAGARYGTGSLFGVILIETRDPRLAAGAADGADILIGRGGRRTFDWSLEPRGHPALRAAGAAFLSNAVGLAAGVGLARLCFSIDEHDQIRTECDALGNTAAIAAGFALPALGSALGARVGGRTEGSEGSLVPALVGATMALLPGYVYSVSTVGRGSDAANVAGAVLLLVGTPLAVTVADRLFRHER